MDKSDILGMKKWLILTGLLLAAAISIAQPSTRLRLTQLQDAPDTINAYFIVAGQGDTVLYKSDIVSIDSSGRVFTVVVGTDTIRWEDTTGGGGGDSTWLKPELEAGNYVKINMKDSINKSGKLEFYVQSPNTVGFVDTLVRFVADSISDDVAVVMTQWATSNPGASSYESWSIYSTDGLLILQTKKNGVNGQGIKYEADYSANYTNRSLVDKGYVLSQISDSLGKTEFKACS